MWLRLIPLVVLVVLVECGENSDTKVGGEATEKSNISTIDDKSHVNVVNDTTLNNLKSIGANVGEKKSSKTPKITPTSTTTITSPTTTTTTTPTTTTPSTTSTTTTPTTTTSTTTTSTTTTSPTTTVRTTSTTITTTPKTTTEPITSSITNTTPKPHNETTKNEDKFSLLAGFNKNYLYFLFLLIPIGSIPMGIMCYMRKHKEQESSIRTNKSRRQSIPSWVFSEPAYADEEIVTLNESKN